MAATPRPDSPVSSPSTWAGGLLPLGALACGLGLPGWAGAQTEAATGAVALPKITITAPALPEQGKDGVQAVRTTIGKGEQALRDIPQSVTVVTERLIDDRNLDTFKDTLRNTAGITFMAAEGGEEDIRLRGFSLQATGDIFVDGMRDPAFYERDTFNYDRLELLRGSASMLFGRGSTGGAVNQVNKLPMLMDEHEVSTTLGSHNYRRLTSDFNFKTGENAALRVNAMHTKADNNGAGSSIEKAGVAGSLRWGIGTADEFLASLYYLNNNNGINYGLPWVRPTSASTASTNTLLSSLDPATYYGMASDRNDGSAAFGTLSHRHRFDSDTELKTAVRKGVYERDQRASAIRFRPLNALAGSCQTPFVNGVSGARVPAVLPGLDTINGATELCRGINNKVQDLHTVYAQSDLSTRFDALGVRHEVLTGVDIAREDKRVYGAIGTQAAKPRTTIGSPDDGAWVDEDARVLGLSNQFAARSWGVYAQDLMQVAPDWKLLGGLRYDSLKGQYDQVIGTAAIPVGRYEQKISEWSRRFGMLYQPSPLHSFHFSYGTSFNTSGDTYSYSPLSANTPPEQSVNLELGARLDSESKRYTTRIALFRSTKTNERNTDVDSAATNFLLSAKRHSAGIDMDITGRLTPTVEVYGSYMWMPIAVVDETAQNSFGNRKGDRTGLSPRHSGTFWTTWQATSRLRVGGGINFRSGQAPADLGTANGGERWEAPGFVTGDLMAEYALVPQSITLKANVSNVSNKLYAESLYRGHYVPGAGRLVQVSASYKF